MVPSNQSRPGASARKRAEIIMKVRCGLMSASQGAAALGVSRKTYYKWEQRGLAGLLDGVSGKKAGRPEKLPAQESALEKQLAATVRDNELLRQKLVLKDLVFDMEFRSDMDRKKKK